jgi:ketosteroid isomerase-like protein
MKRKLYLLWIVFAGVLAACGGSFAPTETPDPALTFSAEAANAVKAVIQANNDAANRKDLKAYLATLYPGSDMYINAQNTMQQVFNAYTLNAQITNLSVMEIGDVEARAAFRILTRHSGGGDYKDNQVSGVFILRKSDGEWKLYNQEIHEVMLITP